MPNTKKTEKPKAEKPKEIETMEEVEKVVKAEPVEITKEEPVSEEKQLIADLKRRMEELEKTNAMLVDIADNKSKAFYYEKNQEELPKEISVRSLDGKVIVAWKPFIDKIETNPITGSSFDKQETMIFFQDGSSRQLPIVFFEKNFSPIKCRLLSILSSVEDNTISYKVKRYDNGEEFEISATFVN